MIIKKYYIIQKSFYFVNKISFSLLFSKIAVVRNILLNVSGVMGMDYRYDNERG